MSDIEEWETIIREYEEEIAKLYGIPKHLLTDIRDPKNEEN